MAALFLIGVLLSLIGSLPPGMISLSIAYVAVRERIRCALLMAAGAAFAEFFQALVAVYAAQWFLNHPGAERWFQMAALPVFWGLAAYLLFWAQPAARPAMTEARGETCRNAFFKGVLLSAFNMLAIPYWFVYCAWLRSAGYWRDGAFSTAVFAAGVSAGAWLALALYAWLGREMARRSDKAGKIANRVTGLIFLGLGAKIAWDLWAATR